MTGRAAGPERAGTGSRPARPVRPRDALGRPLPVGSVGVDGPASRPDRTAFETLTEAQRWLDRGMPFAAHEVLEDAWKAAPTAERDLWQGLAQLAVGLTHARRGNEAGADTVLRRGASNIAAYRARPPFGIDVAGLQAWAARRPVGDPPRLLR